jgi:hypothetical protein
VIQNVGQVKIRVTAEKIGKSSDTRSISKGPSQVEKGLCFFSAILLFGRSRHNISEEIRGDRMNRLKLRISLCAIALLAFSALATAAQAAELYLLGGAIQPGNSRERSYSWQLEYRQDLLKHLAAGISYLNEGHIREHHRDGYTAQLWGRTELLDYRLTLGAAVGPYFFLDTTKNSTPVGFSNDHGWKAMMSLAAAWHLENNVILELRSNWVEGQSGFDSASILAGIGYHFEPALEPQPSAQTRRLGPKNEITLFLGQTIANSLDSQKAIAAGLEYRRHVTRHVDWTFGGIYEGDNRLIRRDGIVTQLWAVQTLVEDTLQVGAGVGAYFDIGHYNNPFNGANDDRFVSAIVTLTGSYFFAPQWGVRASWNRVVTNYERDTDVILAGLGYRF